MSRKSPAPIAAPSAPLLGFPVLTLRQAFQALGGTVPLRTIRWWISTGRVEAVRPGTTVLVNSDSLRDFVLSTRRIAVNAPSAKAG